jgi:hypothetical protein
VFTVVVTGCELVEDEPPQALTSAAQASAVIAAVAPRRRRTVAGRVMVNVGSSMCMRAY